MKSILAKLTPNGEIDETFGSFGRADTGMVWSWDGDRGNRNVWSDRNILFDPGGNLVCASGLPVEDGPDGGRRMNLPAVRAFDPEGTPVPYMGSGTGGPYTLRIQSMDLVSLSSFQPDFVDGVIVAGSVMDPLDGRVSAFGQITPDDDANSSPTTSRTSHATPFFGSWYGYDISAWWHSPYDVLPLADGTFLIAGQFETGASGSTKTTPNIYNSDPFAEESNMWIAKNDHYIYPGFTRFDRSGLPATDRISSAPSGTGLLAGLAFAANNWVYGPSQPMVEPMRTVVVHEEDVVVQLGVISINDAYEDLTVRGFLHRWSTGGVFDKDYWWDTTPNRGSTFSENHPNSMSALNGPRYYTRRIGTVASGRSLVAISGQLYGGQAMAPTARDFIQVFDVTEPPSESGQSRWGTGLLSAWGGLLWPEPVVDLGFRQADAELVVTSGSMVAVYRFDGTAAGFGAELTFGGAQGYRMVDITPVTEVLFRLNLPNSGQVVGSVVADDGSIYLHLAAPEGEYVSATADTVIGDMIRDHPFSGATPPPSGPFRAAGPSGVRSPGASGSVPPSGMGSTLARE